MIILAITVMVTVVIGYRLWRRWRLGCMLRQVVDMDRSTPLSEHRLIHDLLRFGCRPSELWHDLYVPKGDGHYAQVDAVALTAKGIVVFEVKEYSGRIYGDGQAYRWKQFLRGRREPRSFYSPVRQNEGHVRVLKHLLRPYGSVPYWSVVVFYGDCRIKDYGEIPANTFVIRARHLGRTMREITRSVREADYRDVEEICGILDRSASNGGDATIRSEHVEYVTSLRHRPSWLVRLWRWLWRWLMDR